MHPGVPSGNPICLSSASVHSVLITNSSVGRKGAGAFLPECTGPAAGLTAVTAALPPGGCPLAYKASPSPWPGESQLKQCPLTYSGWDAGP